MEPAASEMFACSSFGCALEEQSDPGLDHILCLLRLGVGGEDQLPQASLNGLNSKHFGGRDRFGVYKIERRPDGSLHELGHGGMGVTYRAIDTTLQRRVALKIIKVAIAGRSAEAREWFLREARAAAALRHEHIATVFQFGIHEETGQWFYAMELIEGETLEERVCRAGPLDVPTAIYIAQQVAAALAAAERGGLIHRDIKPANLLLGTAEGGDKVTSLGHAIPAVKVIDFGLAKTLNAPVDRMRLRDHRFIGTPAFASPEQFEDGTLDARSDIYSLGLTLWFALTGRMPFEGNSLEEIRRARLATMLRTEQLKAAQVPFRVRSLLKSMLAADPSERPGTDDLAAWLQRCTPKKPGVRRGHVALAISATLALGLFAFRSPRTASPVTGATSSSSPSHSQMINSIQIADPSTVPPKIDPANWAQQDGISVLLRRMEHEVSEPKSSQPSITPAKKITKKEALPRRRNVARGRPNFFGKFVAGFIKLKKSSR